MTDRLYMKPVKKSHGATRRPEQDAELDRMTNLIHAIGNVIGRPTTNYASALVQLQEQTKKLDEVFNLIAACLEEK